MGLTKQAKTLCKSQVALLFMMLKGTRYPLRNKVIALLSIKAGLRAKEIANLTWAMVTDAQGQLSRKAESRSLFSFVWKQRLGPLVLVKSLADRRSLLGNGGKWSSFDHAKC